MTEEALQEALEKATGFHQRQGILKQLWNLRRQREAEAEVDVANQGSERQPSRSVRRVPPRPAEPVRT